MEKDVEDYIDNTSNMLNGQLRGVINSIARSENLALIQLTMVDVWEKASQYTEVLITNQQAMDKLKEELKDGNKD